MKHNKKYVDTSNVEIYPISCNIAKPIIVSNHYLHKWSACKYAYGVFSENFLIGCLIYGAPVGRLTTESITKTIKLERSKVMELTRLWIADGYGTNIESYAIGKSFKYLRKEGIDVLLSYADPGVGHLGKIYQATNWIYQGDNIRKVKSYDFYINGEKLHPRNVVHKYGSSKDEILKEIDPNYYKKEVSNKHRYVYILNKKLRAKILKDLKHPMKEYV